jgi:hypothetical protein
MPGDYFRNHLTLCRGFVLQHWLADEITDGPHILHGRPALIIHPHEATVQVDTHAFQSPP